MDTIMTRIPIDASAGGFQLTFPDDYILEHEIKMPNRPKVTNMGIKIFVQMICTSSISFRWGKESKFKLN